MGNGDSVVKPRTTIQKLLRAFLLITVSLLALFSTVRLIWRFSGSNKWELFAEKNGAKVFILKEPGADLRQFKGGVRVRSTLAGVVKWLMDPDACYDIGCTEAKFVDRVDDQLEYTSFRYNIRPFRTREYVVRMHCHQDPGNKEVLVEYVATPNKIPPNDCCFRVTQLNATWRLTPLPNGEVDTEYTVLANEGGFMPDLMLNTTRPKYILGQLLKLQSYLDREKYQSAKFDFIQEVSTPASQERADAPGIAKRGSTKIP